MIQILIFPNAYVSLKSKLNLNNKHYNITTFLFQDLLYIVLHSKLHNILYNILHKIILHNILHIIYIFTIYVFEYIH